MHIELAALAVGNPSELSSIMAAAEGGEARAAAVHTGFMKLPSSMRDLKREVVSLVESGKLRRSVEARSELHEDRVQQWRRQQQQPQSQARPQLQPQPLPQSQSQSQPQPQPRPQWH